jgi:CRP-like cAMP-binding protein
MVAIELLLKYSASVKKYAKNEIIFFENTIPLKYYQIISGEIKMFNLNEDGREFIQGIFNENESFGEPPLFSHRPYPASAITMNDVELVEISIQNFLKLLNENSDVALQIIINLSNRLHFKAVMASGISSHEPEYILLSFLKYYVTYLYKTKNNKVDLTRQQIADITGLRVETVIRVVKKLESKQLIKLINRKIHL